MGKSLYEFSKDKKMRDVKANQSEISNIIGENKEKLGNLDEDTIKKKIKDYSKLSQSELMGELQREVSKQKAGGGFDINKLNSQLQNIRPILDKKQNDNLEKILKNLK